MAEKLRHARVGLALRVMGLAWLLLVSGCGKARSGPPASQPASAPASRPAQPVDPEEAAAAMEILVSPAAADRRQEKPSYVQDEKVPSGHLAGAVRFVGRLKGEVPAPEPLDVAQGPFAVKDPAPGEVEYYQNIRLMKEDFLRRGDRKMVFPAPVALMVRDVKEGLRPAMMPTGFMSMRGVLQALAGSHGDYTSVSFSPPKQFVTFFTYESYPMDFVLTRGGSTLFEGGVSYSDKGRQNAQEVGGGHVIWIASKPEPIQSPVLTELGLYEVASRRHPWKHAYLLLVDNPYVAVINRDPKFLITNLPAGKHRMDVWHPVFTPVRKTIEFEIIKDETTEVFVDFHPPEFLTTLPAEPPKKPR